MMNKTQLQNENERFLEMVKEFEVPYGMSLAINFNPFYIPTEGTTATESCLPSTGRYSKPVYYDWGANWDHVSKLVPTKEVQDALKRSIDEARDQDENEFLEFNSKSTWPIVFFLQGSYGDFLKYAIRRNYTPKELVAECNSCIANWYSAIGRRMIKDVGISLWDAEEDRVLIAEEASGRRLMTVLSMKIDKTLFKTAENSFSPLREMLLCAPTRGNSFIHFNYKLAELISPPRTNLRVYGDIVVDEDRNIVFDNYAYFSQIPASKALLMARLLLSEY